MGTNPAMISYVLMSEVNGRKLNENQCFCLGNGGNFY